MNINSPPPIRRTHRGPSSPLSSGSTPVPVPNYFTGGKHLHSNAYTLNILETRALISRLALAIHDLERRIKEMSIRHEEAEQETQLQIYWYKNKLKDFEDQQTGDFYEASCDATYYAAKYWYMKKLME
jgi:hypothetical protein